MKPRKIAVLSEARATYGYVKRVMHLIEQSEPLELQLIVSGMHLLKEYGSSINEIGGEKGRSVFGASLRKEKKWRSRARGYWPLPFNTRSITLMERSSWTESAH